MNKLFALTVFATLTLGLGCTPMTPAQQARTDRVLCEAHALTPLLLSDTDFLVQELEDGVTNMDAVIADAMKVPGQVKANIDAVKAAFAECNAQFPNLQLQRALKH